MEEKMVSSNANTHKCEAYQYGNKERNSKYVTIQGNDKGVEGFLKRNQLDPGKIMFYYQ